MSYIKNVHSWICYESYNFQLCKNNLLNKKRIINEQDEKIDLNYLNKCLMRNSRPINDRKSEDKICVDLVRNRITCTFKFFNKLFIYKDYRYCK